MARVKGIFLLLLFYPSSDKLHFSAVMLSTKLSKRISYQVFPSRPPTIKAHSCCIPPYFFSFYFFFFFLKKEKNNIFLRRLTFISFFRVVEQYTQKDSLPLKKPSSLHTPGKGMHTGVKMGNIQGQEVLHYPQKHE